MSLTSVSSIEPNSCSITERVVLKQGHVRSVVRVADNRRFMVEMHFAFAEDSESFGCYNLIGSSYQVNESSPACTVLG